MAEVPNVLATRYATEAMRVIWAPANRIVLEREFWIAVMKAQRDLGVNIPAEAIAAYERVRGQVDEASIAARERVTRHDVKARIDEFCELAGHEQVHKGLTSRDLTENVEQLQVVQSLREVRRKGAACVARLARRAEEWRDVPLAARTHNVAAQLTTLGRRIAMFGEEMLGALEHLDHVLATLPLRGIKGAVGTQLDQLSLLGGDASRVAELERRVAAHLGMTRCLSNTGQVYPRALDLRVVSVLCETGAAAASFATTLRLMAGQELAGEGFAPGQTGSSAMPHKMNARSCERIAGFEVILRGHLAMAAGLAGAQWNEGDVSCSVVRRVMLPDAFFAMDGLLETFLTVLDQMQVYPAALAAEVERYLPFLLSTSFLMAAVKGGAGRETAHEAVKEHALAVMADLRAGRITHNDLGNRLTGDARLGLDAATVGRLLDEGRASLGAAAVQTDAFVAAARSYAAGVPEAAEYQPGPIL
jgi:adenylosuccinate lyase